MLLERISLSTQSVGVGPGGSTSMLARVVIINYWGVTLMDHFVRPTMTVSDYRTSVTGIVKENLEPENAVPFDEIQKLVGALINDKIILGHSLWNDLSANTRDVALYRPFRETLNVNSAIGLSTLMWRFMNRKVQTERVDPLENARAVMDLYRSMETEFEDAVANKDWPFSLPPELFARCYL